MSGKWLVAILGIARSALLLVLALGLTAGCSLRRMAVNTLGDALAGGGATFASDEDPDLVKAAVPFSLKLMESLLAESPQHQGLLLALSSGFTQYAYGFVHQEADELEEKDLAAADALRSRARRLYLRARNYGLRGLETKYRGFEKLLRENPKVAMHVTSRKDVALLYWTAVSWGAAISLSKDNPDLVADQPVVEAMIDRALELDESFDQGAIHSFLISYEMARPGGMGDPAERSRKHFERAMQLSGGRQASPLVAYAEAVSISKQDRAGFEALLNRALAVNPDAMPETRLANLVTQRRARWLLHRTDDLFVESEK